MITDESLKTSNSWRYNIIKSVYFSVDTCYYVFASQNEKYLNVLKNVKSLFLIWQLIIQVSLYFKGGIDQ